MSLHGMEFPAWSWPGCSLDNFTLCVHVGCSFFMGQHIGLCIKWVLRVLY